MKTPRETCHTGTSSLLPTSSCTWRASPPLARALNSSFGTGSHGGGVESLEVTRGSPETKLPPPP
eukprot:3740615-Prymnesium_polylepis.1